MSANLTNFLPRERARSVRGEYRFRVATLAAILLAALVLVHGILLIPAYLYLSDKADAEAARLAELSSGERDGTAGVAARAKALEQDSARLLVIASSTPASDLVAAILAVPRTGITLTGLSYDAGAAPRLILTGMASTRDTLRAYDLALAALPYVANAELPLSAYAKESEIPFSILLTGPLRP